MLIGLLVWGALFLHTLSAVLDGQPDPAQRPSWDTAIMACYKTAGITADPSGCDISVGKEWIAVLTNLVPAEETRT